MQLPPREQLEVAQSIMSDGYEAIKRGLFQGSDAKAIASFLSWLKGFIAATQYQLDNTPMTTPMPEFKQPEVKQ